MKTLDIAETVKTATPVTTRTLRLQHWARLVRGSRTNLLIFHNLEHWSKIDLTTTAPRSHSGRYQTAFHLAENDPGFQAQGLKQGSSFAQHMQFFELTQAQLHEFSCDCGGSISNTQMADRIEGLAGGTTPTPMMARVVNGITRMVGA